MKKTISNLDHLKESLKQVIKDAKNGKLTKTQAADRIAELKEQMDNIEKRLRE